MASLPLGLRVVARILPLTYGVEVLQVAMAGGEVLLALLDLAVLTAFTAAFFGLASWILARRVAQQGRCRQQVESIRG